MLRRINRLNEEISRWAFEILFKQNKKWIIAFTNPTAGPWKTIKADSLSNGKNGEVYRFILEEDRPDIIMYNDELKAVIIFEAKDSLVKLTDKTQYKKSADVVIKLSKILYEKRNNEFWKGRENYKVILGLLWGANDEHEKIVDIYNLFDLYQSLVTKEKRVFSNVVVGVETLYKNDSLKCYFYSKSYDEDSKPFSTKIIDSLK